MPRLARYPAIIKLASIAVHAEELIEMMVKGEKSGGLAFDVAAIKGLLADPDVKEVLEELRGEALLPVKRSE